ncbi:MAG: flagellar protein FliS [Lachnospiraceae bacterium]|nr:flagellar protein FliS [Lachnospiraceae bacterium]
MTAELKQEYTRRISQANRSGIIVIVYELADQYLKEAEDAIAVGSKDEYTRQCHAAMDCVQHLLNALDDSYELAIPLMNLYVYINKEISMSCARYDTERLGVARKQLAELGLSFAEVAKADASKPVMENSQSVYAGLTYGKGTLNENLSDQGGNRGFQA